jgi:hypothetical protein
MNLFIELYLDEDVDVLLAYLVRARGFSAVTTHDAGRLASSDREQLCWATAQHKTFLTHNREHFELLAAEFRAMERPHGEIIIAERHPPYELLRRLLRILNHVTADEMRNQIRYI